MGQQQSILLTLLLYSKRNCPLIIDQPEDNLDSEFIYKTLVKNLKRIKEHRQVIIATHNANIAILGDSELLLPLKSTNEKTSIVHRGSIDNSKTNKIACNILEGGEVAFKKRQSIYKNAPILGTKFHYGLNTVPHAKGSPRCFRFPTTYPSKDHRARTEASRHEINV